MTKTERVNLSLALTHCIFTLRDLIYPAIFLPIYTTYLQSMACYFKIIFFTLVLSIGIATYGGKELWAFGSEDTSDFTLPRGQGDLERDLRIVDYWNKKIYDRMPVTYDHLLQGGYLNMPSARMGAPGEIGVGFASVPPYRHYNVRCQLMDRLEVSGNYRIFDGVPDPILSPHGFGDFSDKGANFKFAILHPEDSDYQLPGFAFGMEDFHGTRSFRTRYLVLTQVFLEKNLEISFGYGQQRIQGFFGGAIWMPWRKSCNSYLKGISLVAEYDAINYRNPAFEKHPRGRVQKNPINIGLKYRLWDYLDFSVASVRGTEVAWSASAFYNFGETEGFLPKIDDSMPYRSPVDNEPIGWQRPEEVMVEEFLNALYCQGFYPLDCRLGTKSCGQRFLRFEIYNDKYRLESEVRDRLNHLLAFLTPSNIQEVIIVISAEGFPVQEYHYCRDFLQHYAEKEIGEFELSILTPVTEVSFSEKYNSELLFKEDRELYTFYIMPKTHSLFGSANGKFKYAYGIDAGLNGFIFDNIYYSLLIGKIFFSNLSDASDTDLLNPSQIINVRTDVINYYKQRGFTLDEFYLQKNWNMGRGWYSRLTGGYFEQEYGGLAGQVLYSPVNSPWAIGFEAGVLRKRKTHGLGFTEKIRKLDGFTPTYRKFTGSQFFLDLFYDLEAANIDFQVSIGKFLANDAGARFVVSRYFSSGLRISLWYTATNAHDIINGSTYHDKGFEFSMPLDIFYTTSSREKWGYGMSAWLRDSGFRCTTGQDLYYMINDLRQ